MESILIFEEEEDKDTKQVVELTHVLHKKMHLPFYALETFNMPEIKNIITNIPSLLLDDINKYILPITTEIKNSRFITTSKKDFFINFIAGIPLLYYIENNKKILYSQNLPPNDTLHVVALLFNQDGSYIQPSTVYDYLKFDSKTFNTSGIYNTKTYAENIYFCHILDLYKKTNEIIRIDFANEIEAQKKLSLLQKYIISLNNYNKNFYGKYLTTIDKKYNIFSNYTYISSKKDKKLPVISDIEKRVKLVINDNLELYNYNIYHIYKQLSVLPPKKDPQFLYSSLHSYIKKPQKSRKNLEYTYKNKYALNLYNKKLSDLSVNEKKIIQKKYDTFIQQKQGVFNISDNIYKSFDNVDNLKKIIKSLKLPKENENMYVLTSGELICPHLIKKSNYIIDNATINMYSILDDADKIVRDEYGIEIYPLYVCRICGENLYKVDENILSITTPEDYGMHDTDETMYKIISSEVSYIISNFVVGVNKTGPQLTKSIILLIIDNIKDIRRDLLKIKVMTGDELDVILNVYICIYTFAALVQIVFANKSLSFKEFDRPTKKGGDSSDSLRLKLLLNTALGLIKYAKFKSISATEYLKYDDVKPLFMKAYSTVMNKGYSKISISTAEEFLDNNIIQYFIVQYNKKLKEGDMKKKGLLYRHYLINKKDEIANKLFNLKDYNELTSVNKKEIIYQNLLPESANGYEIFLLYLKQKRYNIYGIDVEYLKQLDEINFYYYQKHLEYKRDRLNPVSAINMVMPVYNYNNNTFKKCKGCPRIFVYSSGNKTIEFNYDDIVQWYKLNNIKQLTDFKKYKLCEIKCTCQKKKLDNKKLTFFLYYTTYCPAGDLHNFEKDKCNKCGLTKTALTQNDDVYYKKYCKKYEDILNKERKIVEKYIKNMMHYKVIDIKIMPPIKTYTIKNNVNTLATISGISINNLLYLGFAENRDENELKKGINIQIISIDMLNTRRYKLINYMLEIVRTYNTIKNIKNVIKPDDFLKSITDELNINKKSLSSLSKLKKIDINNPLDTNIFKDYEILSHSYLIIDYMYSILIMLHKQLEQILSVKFSKQVVKNILDELIMQDKYLSNYELKVLNENITDIDQEREDIKEVNKDDFDTFEQNAEDDVSDEDVNIITYEDLDMEIDDDDED